MSRASKSGTQSRKRKAEDNVCPDFRKFQLTVSKEASEAALKINTEKRKRYVGVLNQMLEAKRRHREAIKELQAMLEEEKEGYKSMTNRILKFKIYAGVPVDALQFSEDDNSDPCEEAAEDEESTGEDN